MIYTKEKIEELQHRWTTPKGKKLVKLIKESKCYLSPVLFRDKVHRFPGLNDEEIEDGIDLRGAPLAGFDFRVTVRADDDGYAEDIAMLSNIHFEGAILRHCIFQDGKLHDCFFEGADLKHADFTNATMNTCNLQEADLQGVNFHGTKFINSSFIDAILKDINTTGTIVDQKSVFGKEVKSEKDGNFHFASIEYKQIKQMYKNSSLHDFADEFHYKEMVAKRKLIPKKSPIRWLSYIFGDMLCKYGTSFIHVLLGCIVVIVGCALLFHYFDSLLYYNTILEDPTIFESIYFSIVTFTTLGYGDYHVVGNMQMIAAIESFVGAAMMSLFTVIVARKIIRD